MLSLFDELKARGLIKQSTIELERLKECLNGKPISMYVGFDPTKSSLHVGHLIPIMILSHMQKHGHRPICVVGGGTALIGDPSGRDNMREMLSDEKIKENMRGIRYQLSNFIDFKNEKALMVNNYDWLGNEKYIDFIRRIGPHFTVNRMLSAECFKIRMEKGLSFLEFNYMILQAYDFYTLFKKYNCLMQVGGDDQWSNIIAGVELVRRIEGREVYGMTNPLLTRSDGKKMGKTEGGAVWLSTELTSPYDYYQFWRNTTDDDVVKFMKIYTHMPLNEIEEHSSLEGSDINNAKEILAYEATKILHGKDEADKARTSSQKLFAKGDSEDAPSIDLACEDVSGKSAAEIAVKAELFASKGEAKRMIKQGGFSINGTKITDINHTVSDADIREDSIEIKIGKKKFLKIKIK